MIICLYDKSILFHIDKKIETFLKEFENDTPNQIKKMNNVNVIESVIDGVSDGISVSNSSKIFRFKLSDDIMLLITQFAKMHQYDDRHSYKEAWENWAKVQQEYIEREISRLEQLGYKGDVMDKMFKAGRYYFREKTVSAKKETVAVKPVKKRDYIVMSQEIIQAMDKHLLSIMKQTDFKPAKGYVQFCEEQINLLRPEILRLTDQNITAEKLAEKIKKTYKNRYFILSQIAA